MASAAIIGAAVIGAAGSMSAANSNKSAAKKAAAAQAGAVDEAVELDRAIYQDQRRLLAPTARAGAEARARQMLMLGSSPEEVRAFLRESRSAMDTPAFGYGDLNAPDMYDENGNWTGLYPQGYSPTGPAQPYTPGSEGDPDAWVDSFDTGEYLRSTPGYQFRFDEGRKARERLQSASGNLFSGETGIALDEYGQNFATQEFDTQYRRLGGLAGDGDDSTGTIVNVGSQFGQNAGANLRAGGAARASGYLGAGRAEAAGTLGVTNAITGAIGAYGGYKGWFG